MVIVRNRVARRDVLQADERANVSRITHINFLTMVGVHLQQAADPLTLIIAGIIHGHPLLDLP